MNTPALDPLLDDAPCGFLQVSDDGQIHTANATLRSTLGYAQNEIKFLKIKELLTPGSQIYFQVSMLPQLQLGGIVQEVYLRLKTNRGGEVPVLANVRRRPSAGCSDWVIMRIEQRGRWEEEVLQAKRLAEFESRERARVNEELGRAKKALEATLAELKESNWLLVKAAEVLPTCMYCERVKGDKAQWETAINLLKRSSVFLSHGCCPDCVPRMCSDFDIKAENLPS
jgi:phosphoserine phosphatase RsbU/P